MPIWTKCGPQILQNGMWRLARAGKECDTKFARYHGKYTEQSYRGNIFSACQTAGVTMATSGGTAPSFAIYNPASSGKYLSLIRLDGVVASDPVVPAVLAWAVSVNSNPSAAATTGTAITAIPAIVGGTASAVGRPLTSATLPVAPTLFRVFVQYENLKTLLPNTPGFFIDFDGTCLLAPGCTASVGQTGSTDGTPVIFGLIWEEILI
jgi:hypothetical protein